MQHLKTLIIQESIENNQQKPDSSNLVVTDYRDPKSIPLYNPSNLLDFIQSNQFKSQDNLLPFDNINTHNKDLTPKYNHPNHTDDPSKQLQNTPYPPLGNEISLLNTLSNNHTYTLHSLTTRQISPKINQNLANKSLNYTTNHTIPQKDITTSGPRPLVNATKNTADILGNC